MGVIYIAMVCIGFLHRFSKSFICATTYCDFAYLAIPNSQIPNELNQFNIMRIRWHLNKNRFVCLVYSWFSMVTFFIPQTRKKFLCKSMLFRLSKTQSFVDNIRFLKFNSLTFVARVMMNRISSVDTMFCFFLCHKLVEKKRNFFISSWALNDLIAYMISIHVDNMHLSQKKYIKNSYYWEPLLAEKWKYILICVKLKINGSSRNMCFFDSI
jgi:hypothetical protein